MTSKHKKIKGVNENVVATIVHNEYTDFIKLKLFEEFNK